MGIAFSVSDCLVHGHAGAVIAKERHLFYLPSSNSAEQRQG